MQVVRLWVVLKSGTYRVRVAISPTPDGQLELMEVLFGPIRLEDERGRQPAPGWGAVLEPHEWGAKPPGVPAVRLMVAVMERTSTDCLDRTTGPVASRTNALPPVSQRP